MLSKLVQTGFKRSLPAAGLLTRFRFEQVSPALPSRSFLALSSSASSSSSGTSLLSRLLLLAPLSAAVAYRQISDNGTILPKTGLAEELRDFVVKDADKLKDGDMMEV